MYMSEDLQMIKRNSIGKRYDSNFLLHSIVVIHTVFQNQNSNEKTQNRSRANADLYDDLR